MFQKGDRVRQINEQTDKQLGILEIWEIKNGYAVVAMKTIKILEL